jgi:mRNA-degrading endonuclease RelE of RelBE toxin-antitoxin system
VLFVETPLFSRQIAGAMEAEQYRQLQAALLDRPEAGALIPGGGGLRKIRWAAVGRGKRGGTRVIYYWQVSAERIVLVYVYPKNVQADLSRAQIAALRAVIEDE